MQTEHRRGAALSAGAPVASDAIGTTANRIALAHAHRCPRLKSDERATEFAAAVAEVIDGDPEPVEQRHVQIGERRRLDTAV